MSLASSNATETQLPASPSAGTGGPVFRNAKILVQISFTGAHIQHRSVNPTSRNGPSQDADFYRSQIVGASDNDQRSRDSAEIANQTGLNKSPIHRLLAIGV